MRIDAAGHHVQAAGIQRVAALQLVADRGDAAIADADIGAIRVGRRHHGAAADHQIIIGHALASGQMRELGR